MNAACTAIALRPGSGGAGAPGCLFSFDGETEVQLVSGPLRIDEVLAGDQVLALDEAASLEAERISTATTEQRAADPRGTYAYDPRTGWWSLVGVAPTQPGAEFWTAGALYRVTASGAVRALDVALEALRTADATWSTKARPRTPAGTDVVVVLDEGGLRHGVLSEVESGARIGFDGRVLVVEGPSVRPTGEVLGRVLSTMAVIEARIRWEDGSTQEFVATSEHAFLRSDGKTRCGAKCSSRGIRRRRSH